MAKYTPTDIDDFVSAHKRQAMYKIAKEILESLCAYGFNTDELLYAIADIFIERGGLNEAAAYLQQACEHLPVGLTWETKENAEKQ